MAHIMAFNTEVYTGSGEDYDGLGLSTRGAEAFQILVTGNQGGRSDAVAAGTVGGPTEAKLGCMDKCFLTIVSSLKILLKTGVAQISD